MELIDRCALPWEQQELDQDGNWTLKAEYIESAPTIDAVPVVRCRECIHYKENRTKKYGNLIYRCTRMGKYDMDYPVRPDDFCSYGERKET